ncbi:MAG: glycosyltransferase family 9 protein [Chloroflexi bacterium]|nr:glycosyltransferase family 9 protein [Chloroflexota bacterium]
MLSEVRTIAVLRASGIGDLVFALPALDALRAAYPDAEITMIGRPMHAEILESRPSAVDRVIAEAGPFIGDEPEPAGLEETRRALIARLRRESWDLAVQLHGGGRNSNPLVAALGARLTVGARSPDAAPLDRTVPYVYWQHEIHRNLEVVALAGAEPVTIEPRLAPTPADRRVADAALTEAGVPEDAPLAVLHPGASDPRRRWPARSFAGVGDGLADRGLQVVVTGSDGEVGLATEVVGAMAGSGAVAVAGRIGLAGLLGVLARAAVVVANDTGPLHLASALGTPSVGIFWCGNLINAGPPFRARHRPLLSWRLDCPVCGLDCTRGRCAHDDSFVADVPVASVVEAARELLDGRLSTVPGRAPAPAEAAPLTAA